MKQRHIAFLLLAFFCSSAQAAQERDDGSPYVGIFAAQAESGDVKNKNLGLVFGGNVKSGFGAEVFYTDTIDGDEFSSDGLPDVKYSTQHWGLLGTYKLGSKVYAKFKVGYTFLDVTAKPAGEDSEKFKSRGLSYGIGGGIEVGKNGTIELNYLRSPDLELTVGSDFVDVKNEMYSLGYNWYF